MDFNILRNLEDYYILCAEEEGEMKIYDVWTVNGIMES